ncbi:MAG TPA: cupin domain-containing protein [Candidatus Limnocylindrales bacterium]|nr:cupin domain-containing protein [Candidatus Limnocylindrales bacterium]
MNPTRRSLALLFPALAAAQQRTGPQQGKLPSKAFPFDQLSGKQSGSIKLYQILTGDTHSGYRLDLHESELPPGNVPHAPHRHVHEELLFIREGEMEVTINGKATRLGPGSCAYMASNDLHGYSNPGVVPVKYFVLALGND